MKLFTTFRSTNGRPITIDFEDLEGVRTKNWQVEVYSGRIPSVSANFREGTRYKKVSLGKIFASTPGPPEGAAVSRLASLGLSENELIPWQRCGPTPINR